MKSKITQAYLAWKSKTDCSLNKRKGLPVSGCAFTAPRTAGHWHLHRGPSRLTKGKANVIRAAFFPRAELIWG